MFPPGASSVDWYLAGVNLRPRPTLSLGSKVPKDEVHASERERERERERDRETERQRDTNRQASRQADTHGFTIGDSHYVDLIASFDSG